MAGAPHLRDLLLETCVQHYGVFRTKGYVHHQQNHNNQFTRQTILAMRIFPSMGYYNLIKGAKGGRIFLYLSPDLCDNWILYSGPRNSQHFLPYTFSLSFAFIYHPWACLQNKATQLNADHPVASLGGLHPLALGQYYSRHMQMVSILLFSFLNI